MHNTLGETDDVHAVYIQYRVELNLNRNATRQNRSRLRRLGIRESRFEGIEKGPLRDSVGIQTMNISSWRGAKSHLGSRPKIRQ